MLPRIGILCWALPEHSHRYEAVVRLGCVFQLFVLLPGDLNDVARGLAAFSKSLCNCFSCGDLGLTVPLTTSLEQVTSNMCNPQFVNLTMAEEVKARKCQAKFAEAVFANFDAVQEQFLDYHQATARI